MATLFSPLLKLSGILLKFVAKPVAQRMKTSAAKHPWLRRRFVALGQVSHNLQSRINVYASGYKFVGVKPLPEDEALSKATDSFIRSERKNAEKAAASKRKEVLEMQRLEDRFHQLETFVMDIEDVLLPASQAKLKVIRKQRLDDEALKTVEPQAGTSTTNTDDTILNHIIRIAKFW